MNFQQDLIRFGSGLFVGMSLFHFLNEGTLSTSNLISNVAGGIIGGFIYAYWRNRRTKHDIFRKK